MKCYYCNNKVLKKCDNLNFYECKNCGLYARYPMPTTSELKKIYKECYVKSNIIKNKTNQLSPISFYKEMSNYISENFLIKTKNKILDYGCGTGGLLFEFNQIPFVTVDTFGIEFSEEALKIGKEKLKKSIISNDIEKINETFDVITMIEVVEHLPTPWLDLKKIYSKLSENGTLIITTPNLNGLNALLYRCSWREQLKPFHLIMFNRFFIKKLLQDVGFSEIHFPIFYPAPHHTIFQKYKNIILQGLRLHGGIFVYAKK